jgi:hypothetical protein
VTALLADLTRPELDALLAESEHAYSKSHIALANCPLRPEAVADAAGVAQDCLCLWSAALDESCGRWAAGELPL